jgi:hypothetical protein
VSRFGQNPARSLADTSLKTGIQTNRRIYGT